MIHVWTGPYRESYMDMPTNISVERGSLSHINHRSWPAPSPRRLAWILNLCRVHTFRIYTYEGEGFGFLIGQWRVTWLVTIEMFKSLMHYFLNQVLLLRTTYHGRHRFSVNYTPRIHHWYVIDFNAMCNLYITDIAYWAKLWASH